MGRPMGSGTDTRERFDSYWVPEPNSGCWLWMNYLNAAGYGQIYALRKNGTKASRAAYKVGYELYKGPVPDGLELDHKCKQRSCVNPDHLEPVTRTVNVLRSDWPSAINSRKNQCGRGHEYVGENYYIKSTKGRRRRICRLCNRFWVSTAKRRKREQKRALFQCN